jgi:hypothetical protein
MVAFTGKAGADGSMVGMVVFMAGKMPGALKSIQ